MPQQMLFIFEEMFLKYNAIIIGILKDLFAKARLDFRIETQRRPAYGAPGMPPPSGPLPTILALELPNHKTAAEWRSIGRLGIIVNHLPNYRQIFYKNFVISFQSMADACSMVPFTFEVNAKSPREFIDEQIAAHSRLFAPHTGLAGDAWIIKPSSSGGARHIVICRAAEIHDVFRGSGLYSAVVQKYIEQPLLCGGRKFHIRAHFLLMPRLDRVPTGPSDRPRVLGYDLLYDNNYLIYTSLQDYQPGNLAERKAHLTNVGVQGHDVEDQAIRPKEHIAKALGAVSISLEDLDEGIRRIIRRIFRAENIAHVLNPTREPRNFELFGLDIMPDARGRLWLLEINVSPGISVPPHNASEIGKFVMPSINKAMWQEVLYRFGLDAERRLGPQTYFQNIGFVPFIDR